MSRICAWLLVLCVLCTGCSNAPETSGQAGAGEQEKVNAAPEESASGTALAEANAEQKATIPKRNDMTGRWIIALSHYDASGDTPGFEIPVILLDVAKANDGKFGAKLHEVQSQYLPQTIKLKSSEITASSAHLVLEVSADISLDIRGELADGKMFGNIAYGRSECDPVRFLPTEATTLSGLEPRSLPGAEEFDKAKKFPDAFAALQDFRKAFPNSPMTLMAYIRLLASAKEKKADRAVVEEIAKDYFRWAKLWGPRMEFKAHLDYAVILTHNKLLLEQAIAEFTDLEKKIRRRSCDAVETPC